jgi:hypothetical protein
MSIVDVKDLRSRRLASSEVTSHVFNQCLQGQVFGSRRVVARTYLLEQSAGEGGVAFAGRRQGGAILWR